MNYALSLAPTLTGLLPGGAFVRDQAAEDRAQQKLAWDALASSGEYFVYTANLLEGLNAGLDKSSPEYHHLDQLIEQLLYMQQTYRLSKK